MIKHIYDDMNKKIPFCPQFQIEKDEYSAPLRTPNSLQGRVQDTSICINSRINNININNNKQKTILERETKNNLHDRAKVEGLKKRKSGRFRKTRSINAIFNHGEIWWRN